MRVHPTTEIDPSAEIAEDAIIGQGCIIGAGSIVKTGVEIAPRVLIGPNTEIGEGVKIFSGAIIGTDPQDLKYNGSPTLCRIGARTVIREYVTINRGTESTGETVVGSDCYIMAYSHIAHDCRVGSHVIMANNCTLAGHCQIEDNAVLGGYAMLHQFVRVGKCAMIGALSGLRKDAPPFMITFGYPPAHVYGLNNVGLKRSGFPPETRALLKEAFRILYKSGLNFGQALERIKNELPSNPELDHLVKFFETSKRGVSRGFVREMPDDDDGIDEAIFMA